MRHLARVLRCTEGQAYSVAIVAILTIVMVVVGVPAALRGRALAPAAAALASPSVTSTTVAIPRFGEAPPPAVGGDSVRRDRGAAAGGAVSPTAVDAEPPPIGTVTTFARIGDPGAPHGIAVGPDGQVYVATDNGTARGRPGPSAVIALRPDGSVARRYAISGQPEGHVDGVTGLALDGRGRIIALDAATGRVLQIELATGREQSLGTIPDVAPCVPVSAAVCEPGVQDHRPLPEAVVIDAAGRFLVSDAGQATIWQLDPKDHAVRPWYQSLDLAAGDGPSGLAVAADRHVRFSVGTTLDVDALGGGAVYDLAVMPDGMPGPRTLVAGFGRGDQPDGLVVGASGRTYVALRGADMVVVLGADRKEERRVTASMDSPVALAFRGRSLLVANRSRTDRWVLLDVAVDDGGPS